MNGDMRHRYEVATAMLTSPSIALLRSRDAALAITVLTVAFDNSRTTTADRLHALIEQARLEVEGREHHDHTHSTGEEHRRTPKETVERWINGTTRWLTRESSPAGETYRVTEAATEALAIVREQSRARPVTTGSTVTDLMDRVHRTALLATTDPVRHLGMLEAQAADLRERLKRIDQRADDVRAGRGVLPATNEEVYNDFLLLLADGEKILADLHQVESEVRSQGILLHREFLADERPVAEILDDYLRALTTRLSATRHGQGYDSARRLLEDPILRARFQDDLDTVLSHPFTATVERSQLKAVRGMVGSIHQAAGAVLDARTDINTALTGYVHSRHADTHRALPKALLAASEALEQWRHTASPDRPLPANPLQLDDATIKTLRLKPGTARRVDLPAPLAEPEPPSPLTAAADLRHFRDVGGPRYQELANAVTSALTHHSAVGVDDVFTHLDPDTRRPVDLLGLLGLAGRENAFTPHMPDQHVTCTRPDSTHVTFAVPAVLFTTTPALPIDSQEQP